MRFGREAADCADKAQERRVLQGALRVLLEWRRGRLQRRREQHDKKKTSSSASGPPAVSGMLGAVVSVFAPEECYSTPRGPEPGLGSGGGGAADPDMEIAGIRALMQRRAEQGVIPRKKLWECPDKLRRYAAGSRRPPKHH